MVQPAPSPHSPILVITYSGDATAQLVIDGLRERARRVFRLDTDLFPTAVQLVLRQDDRQDAFLVRAKDEELDLRAVRTVWYRRFYSAKLPESVDRKYVAYSQHEARSFLAALFAGLRHARWVDPIERIHRAHHKLLQLQVAREVGLVIPATLSTNDPAEARRFFAQHRGQVVTKMLASMALQADGTEQMVFTSKVTEEHLADLDGLAFCPAVFQELVEKDVELRVVVIGRRVFVASIDSKGSATGSVDWRQDKDLADKFRPDTLPADVEAKVLSLMDFYGLTYGSLDLIRRPDGTYVFLEINSAGEWGWLALLAGLPIPEAMADELCQDET